MEKIVTIELFGEKYSFKAESGVANAGEIANLLTKEVASIEEQMSVNALNMNKISIVTLAALNIISEYVEMKQAHADFMEKLSKRSASLTEKIDMTLQ